MLVTWINYPVWNKVIQAKSVCVRIRFPSILPVIDLRKLECYKIEHTLRKTQLISLSRTFVPFQVRNSRSAHLAEALKRAPRVPTRWSRHCTELL
jgi:hypothetical protein